MTWQVGDRVTVPALPPWQPERAPGTVSEVRHRCVFVTMDHCPTLGGRQWSYPFVPEVLEEVRTIGET